MEILTVDEAAKFLGISTRLLARFRVEGGGPAFIRIGHRTVRYTKEDLESWVRSKRRSQPDL